MSDKNQIYLVYKNYRGTNLLTTPATVWTPDAGASIVLTSITLGTTKAATIVVAETSDTAGKRIIDFTFGDGGGIDKDFTFPLRLPKGAPLILTSTVDAAVVNAVFYGYEE